MTTLLDQFEAGTLDPAEFSHRDHVICAHEALSRYEFFEAMALYAKGLKHLTAKAGAPEKFSATITFAFMSEIAARMDADSAPTEAFLDRNRDLLGGAGVLSRYSEDQLRSALSRRVALLPA